MILLTLSIFILLLLLKLAHKVPNIHINFFSEYLTNKFSNIVFNPEIMKK